MVSRYIKSKRTTSNTTSSETDRLRDQFLRELNEQAQSMLKQLSQEFGQDLKQQTSQLLGGLTVGGGISANGLNGLFASTGRFLFNRTSSKETTRESTRSREESERFRLSQSQAMAEASEALSRGDKNR